MIYVQNRKYNQQSVNEIPYFSYTDICYILAFLYVVSCGKLNDYDSFCSDNETIYKYNQ